VVLFKSVIHEFKEYTNKGFEFVFISTAWVETKANKLITITTAVKKLITSISILVFFLLKSLP
jgi:hypothetical protein